MHKFSGCAGDGKLTVSTSVATEDCVMSNEDLIIFQVGKEITN